MTWFWGNTQRDTPELAGLGSPRVLTSEPQSCIVRTKGGERGDRPGLAMTVRYCIVPPASFPYQEAVSTLRLFLFHVSNARRPPAQNSTAHRLVHLGKPMLSYGIAVGSPALRWPT